MKMRVDSEKELEKVAARIAPLLRPGDVVTLTGDLGAGKTALARALVNLLSSAPEEVPSPTFTLAQVYDFSSFSDFQGFSLWHFDLYRLEVGKESDILELGWDEARRSGVSLVEWPDRLGSLLPRDRLEISISFVKDSENSRDILFAPEGKWAARF